MKSIVYKALAGAGALMLAAAIVRAEVVIGRESFAGRNNRGPYNISRLQIEARSETVYVNGLRKQRGRDYLFDEATGVFSFSEPVRSSDLIEVDYRYDTAKAKTAGATSGTLGLFANAHSGIGLTYTFNPDSNGGQQLGSLGVSGNTTLGGLKFASQFVLDETAKQGGADAQNINLSAKQDTGRLKLDLSYSRVGSSFSQAEAFKVVKGSNALNFSGSYQLGANSLLTAKRTSTDTPDAKTGKVVSTFLDAATFASNIGTAGKLNALREVKSETKDGHTTSSEVARLAYEHRLGPRTGASFVQETTTNEKDGKGETVTASRFNVDSTGDNGLKVNAGFALTDSSKSGNARDASIKVERGNDAGRLVMSLTDRQADAGDLRTHALTWSANRNGLKWVASNTGDTTGSKSNNQSLLSVEGGKVDRLQFAGTLLAGSGEKGATGYKLSLAAKPSDALKWSLSRDDQSVNGKDSEKTNAALNLQATKTTSVAATWVDNVSGNVQKSTGNVLVEAKPSDAMKLTAKLTSVQDDEKGDNSAQSVDIEAKPGRDLHVAASYADLDDKTGNTQASKIAISAGRKEVKLTASQALTDAPSGLTAVSEAGVSLAPGEALKLTGSYREEAKPSGETTVSVVSADFKPATALAVTGSMKQRDGTTDLPDTLHAQVTLKPAKSLQLVGTYSENPEEKDNILRLVRRGLALTSTLGSLGLTAGYYDEQSLLDGAQGNRAELGLKLRLGRFAEFAGGYEQTVGSMRGKSPLMAYNVRYTHKVGTDFNLLLDANVKTLDYGLPTQKEPEVKATANLGVKF
jgi:hypothetical protein